MIHKIEIKNFKRYNDATIELHTEYFKGIPKNIIYDQDAFAKHCNLDAEITALLMPKAL